MSGKHHCLCVVRDQQELSRFMHHLGCNISKEIGGRLRQWRGAFWERRYDGIVEGLRVGPGQAARGTSTESSEARVLGASRDAQGRLRRENGVDADTAISVPADSRFEALPDDSRLA